MQDTFETLQVYLANITSQDKTGYMEIYRSVYFLKLTITRWLGINLRCVNFYFIRFHCQLAYEHHLPLPMK